MAERADQHADLVLRLFQLASVLRQKRIAEAHARPVNFEISFGRNRGEVVLRLPEHAAFRFGHADHFERHPVDADAFPDGIGAGEKPFLEIRAQEDHVHMAPVLDVGDEAPGIDLGIGHHRPVGRGADQLDAVDQVGSVG